jgi:hypothetical protein
MARGGERRLSIDEEGRQLIELLGGRWGPSGGMCRCPAHDDRTPSLSVRPGRSRLLLHCFAGCDPSTILRALEADRLLEPGPGGIARPESGLRDDRRDSAALRLWRDARPIGGTPAAAYLESRGIEAAPAELRYHPRTPLGRAPLTQYRPALIAAMRDDSGLLAIHRTFIDPFGRGLAPLPNPRRGLGRFGRGAVRLGGSAPRLGLAEGIETALSATALFGVPCWAALGSGRFGGVAFPAEVRELVLFLDNDAGGRRAELLAREAYSASLRIETHVPDARCIDWNDVLRALEPGAAA